MTLHRNREEEIRQGALGGNCQREAKKIAREKKKRGRGEIK